MTLSWGGAWVTSGGKSGGGDEVDEAPEAETIVVDVIVVAVVPVAVLPEIDGGAGVLIPVLRDAPWLGLVTVVLPSAVTAGMFASWGGLAGILADEEHEARRG